MRLNLAAEIKQIAKRVERNVPRHGDPEAFHAEKSEIVTDLKTIAKELEKNSVV